jgi:hypothetical protein
MDKLMCELHNGYYERGFFKWQALNGLEAV